MIRLEFSKLRRLKVGLLVAVMTLAVILMSIAPLFRKGEPPQMATLLMSLGTIQAFLAPIFVSIVATRIVEIEHSGNGWQIAGSVGALKGKVCLLKAIVAGLISTITTIFITGIIIFLAMAKGIQGFEPKYWLNYTLCLLAVNLVICMVHVILAAKVDNQLINVGTGILGGFIASFSLLIPTNITYFIPWAYYALISHFDAKGQIAYHQPNYFPIIAFVLIATAAFAVSVRQLDRAER